MIEVSQFAEHQQFVALVQLIGDRAVVVHVRREANRVRSEYVRLPLEALVLQLHHRRIADRVRLLVFVVVGANQFVFVRLARDHTGAGGLDGHLKSGQVVLQREPPHAAVRSNVVGRLLDGDQLVIVKHSGGPEKKFSHGNFLASVSGWTSGRRTIWLIEIRQNKTRRELTRVDHHRNSFVAGKEEHSLWQSPPKSQSAATGSCSESHRPKSPEIRSSSLGGCRMTRNKGDKPNRFDSRSISTLSNRNSWRALLQ